jgi:hypothetical protein
MACVTADDTVVYRNGLGKTPDSYIAVVRDYTITYGTSRNNPITTIVGNFTVAYFYDGVTKTMDSCTMIVGNNAVCYRCCSTPPAISTSTCIPPYNLGSDISTDHAVGNYRIAVSFSENSCTESGFVSCDNAVSNRWT